MPKSTQQRRVFIYLLTCVATIGGLMFGYDIGSMSGAMILIRKQFDLSTTWQQAIVSCATGTAAISAFLAGYLNEILGRRKVILIASFLFTLAALVMGASVNKYMLLVARLVLGIGVGFVSMTAPVYVAEAAPADIRGRLVTMNQVMFTIGTVISSVLAGAFSGDQVHGWKYMLGLAGVPSALQFTAFIFAPESPRWLIKNGRFQEAENALVKIRRLPSAELQSELNEIKDAAEKDRLENEVSGGSPLKKIITTPHVRKALLIGCGLQMFQQLSGINAVIYYSASILQMAGFPDSKAIWLACIPNTVNFFCTSTSLYFVERIGRKILIIVSMAGVTISCIVLAIGFQLQLQQTPSINKTLQIENYPIIHHNDSCFSYTTCDSCVTGGCGLCFVERDLKIHGGACISFDGDLDEPGSHYGHCYNSTTRELHGVRWTSNYCPTDVAWVTVLGLALYIMTFAPGMGPLPWTINSEIYPLWARSTGNSIAAGTNWSVSLLVAFTFLTILDAASKHGAFYIFAGICLTGTIFFILFAPETKNKTLEEVEMLFMTPEKRKELSAAKYAKDNEAFDTKM